MMVSIFISHSGKNKDIARALVNFLKTGANVVDVFCSSHPGNDILVSSDFKDFIDDNIKKSDIFIALYTPNYLESNYCFIELGIAYTLNKTIIPIVAFGTDFREMTAICDHIQGVAINDSSKLPDISDIIRNKGHKVSASLWQDSQNEFIETVNKLLKKQPEQTKIDFVKYKKLVNENNDLKEKNKNIRAQLIQIEQKLEKISKLKNKEDVEQINKSFSDLNIVDEFEDNCKEIGKMLQKHSRAVQYLIFRHYQDQDQYNYRDLKYNYNMPDNDIDNKYIIVDDGKVYINTDSIKIKKIIERLNDFRDYIISPPDEIISYIEQQDINFDFECKEFWNSCFDLNI